MKRSSNRKWPLGTLPSYYVEPLEQRLLLTAASAGPGNTATPPLGVNIDATTYFSTDAVWFDLAKSFAPWRDLTSSSLLSGSSLTADNYPTQDAGTQTDMVGYPDGIYTLQYQGDGAITISGKGLIIGTPVTVNGITTAQVLVKTNLAQSLILTAQGFDAQGPLSNLHLYMPGYEANQSVPIFNPATLARLKPFGLIRTMDAFNTNGSTVVNWSDRTSPTAIGEGWTYEDAIALANADQVALWLNIPVNASDQFITNLAELIEFGSDAQGNPYTSVQADPLHAALASGLKVYIEYANELWQPGFFTGSQNEINADNNPLLTAPDDTEQRNGQEAAFQLHRIHDLFSSVFGGNLSSSVSFVFAGIYQGNDFDQSAFAYMNTQTTSWGVPSSWLGGYAVAAYIDLSDSEEQALQNTSMTTDQLSQLLFNDLNNHVNTDFATTIASDVQFANSLGLPLFAYEGGQGLVIDSGNISLKIAAETDPRMGTFYTNLLNTWYQQGGSMFALFNFIYPTNPSGGWGLLEEADTPGSPKWDAVITRLVSPGDANLDGSVDFNDFLLLKENWGSTDATWEQGDFNGDGTVDAADLSILEQNLNVASLTPDEQTEINSFQASLGTGLDGVYYSDTSFDNPALNRVDPSVNFNWASSPGPGVPATGFSARWTGLVEAPASATYTIAVVSNDAINVTVDGQQIIDAPGGQASAVEDIGSITLQAGQKYSIEIDDSSTSASPQIELLWQRPGTTLTMIPTSLLYPQGQASSVVGLTAAATSVVAPNTTTLTFTRTNTNGVLSVNYTVGGTAIAGTDYESVPQTITFDDGSPTAALTLNTISDPSATSGRTISIAVASGAGYTAASTASSTITIYPTSSTAGSAAFVGQDTTDQGTWKGIYGAAGWDIIGDTNSLPSGVTLNISGSPYVWNGATSQLNALEKASSSDPTNRIAGTDFASPSFTADLNLGMGQYQVALYLLDYDGSAPGGGGARSEQVQIIDPATNTVLDSRTISNFQGGQYLVYNLSGHVLIQFTKLAGANAVLSGLFFDPEPQGAGTPSITSAATSEDMQTTSGLVFTAADPSTAFYQITGITGGTLFLSDGTTPITNGSFITAAQGAAGLRFTPASQQYSPSQAFSFNAQASTTSDISGLGGSVVTTSITVNRAAHTPSITSASTTSGIQTTSGLVISAAALDQNVSGLAYHVTNITNGTLFQSDGTTQIHNGDFITTAQGTAGLKFTPTAGLSSPTNFTFSVQASIDGTVAGLGGSLAVASIAVASTGNSATFVGADATTQGTWSNVYGADGYDIIGSTLSLPSYASLSFSGASAWTWSASSNQSQALQTAPNSSSRIASTLYGQSFTANLNVGSGQHQVAFYLLDYDGSASGGGGARSEQVQIIDPSNNAVLSTQTVSNFSAGTYLVYNITGNVIVKFTSLAGANAVVSGVFFDASAAPSTPSVTANPQSQSVSAGSSVIFTAAASGNPAPTVQWQVEMPGGSFTNIGGATSTTLTLNNVTVDQNGNQYQAVFTNGNGGATSAAATLSVSVSGNAASFVGSDIATQGNWSAVYGSDGYDVIGAGQSLPSYAALTTTGASAWTWSASTTQPQALQTAPNSSSHIAATLYGQTFSINLNLTGGAHSVALYLLDYDGTGAGTRSEQVQVIDASSNSVLDTRTVSNFSGGTYLLYNLTGNVVVKFTALSGANAVLSGIFFGNVAPASPIVTTNPQSQSATIGATVTFTAAATGSPAATVQWQVQTPGGLFTDISSANSTTLTLTNVAFSQNGDQYRAVFTNVSASVPTSAATLTVTTSTNSASFVAADATTQGTWSNVYGADGYDIIGSTLSLPSYASLSFSGASAWTWSASSNQSQALQTAPNSSSRIASTLYGQSFTANLNVGSGQHQVAFYLLDYDGSASGGGGARSEQVQIIDPSNNAVLSTQTVSNFSAGTYLVYNITGNVIVKFTSLAGANAVVSGVFFN